MTRPHVAVIGGGIIGSWAALHLVEAGVRTTLIEQFPLPHARGSSHGQSRAFRFLGDDETSRLEYSLDRWQALEGDTWESLFVKTGLLNFGEERDPFLERHMAIVRDGGRPCAWMTPAEIAERFPTLRYPGEWGAAWDPNGGILFAHRCVAAVQRRFRELGGELRTMRVEASEVRGGPIVDADRVVVCAGPWTGALVPELAPLLTTVLTPVTYWRDPTGAHSVGAGFPILFNARLTDMYALPGCEYPGLTKVLFHGGPEGDPELVDTAGFGPYVRKVADYVEAHLPGLDHRAPALTESCFYTITPDRRPILGRLSERVVVGAGFSGSGFKHSPATGRMLSALALDLDDDLPPGFALEPFRLSRFTE